MKLLDRPYTIDWISKNVFRVESVDKTIKAEITFYEPLDKRNKVAGKGSRIYRHGLLVACHLYKESKLKEKELQSNGGTI